MIIKLKNILNTYTNEELEYIDLWINSNDIVNTILIEEFSINLITEDTEIKINGFIENESSDK